MAKDKPDPADKRVTRATVGKTVWGEWHVRAYNAAGERVPSADCFESTKAHAQETAAAMVRGVEKSSGAI